jgi:tripartite-type tricarboxylate transporter receptor subunit TctC
MLALAAGMLGMAAAPAQEWPARPIKLIVPFAPGGGMDYLARVIAPKLSERLGQAVVVENRAGANGVVGLQALMSAADGHTFGVISAGPLVVNPHVYLKLPYDTLKDFAPVSNLANFPLLLAVQPTLPARDVKELIAYGKANPGRISYSSPGIGNTNHLAGELFASMARLEMLHIPYKGSAPAVTALLSGDVNSTFSSIPTILPHVRSGRVKVLGVGNAQRIPFLPDIPTIAEAGVPGYEAFTWGGMMAPAGTPAGVVQRLNRELGEILKQKEIADRLLNEGAVPTPSSVQEYDAYIRAELKKWGEIVRMANIKPE